VALPPSAPFTCQVTVVFVVMLGFMSVTVALKSTCSPRSTDCEVGVMLIDCMLLLAVTAPLPQPATLIAHSTNAGRRTDAAPLRAINVSI